MKLFFSETEADYSRYLYPYVVWALREAHEAPADLFNLGFLPSAKSLDQFALCRNIRVDLAKFSPSSENRRILRKGAGIVMKLVPRAEFELTSARKEFFLQYATLRYGAGVMPAERLELVFSPPVCSHVLVFTEEASGTELGVAVMYIEAPRLAFYRYSFFDLNHPNRSLGLFLMTTAVEYFAAEKFQHIYLGTCYSERALYKTQFNSVEFFNGYRWSQNLAELKFLLRRDYKKHLLDAPEYHTEFFAGDASKIFASGGFSVKI